MFKNNNVFDKNTSSKSIKYFIIAFALFILILSVVSVVMFMSSIDFDINNLTGKTTTQPVENTESSVQDNISLSQITAKSKIVLICEKDGNLDFVTLIDTDFEQSYMNISCYDNSDLVNENETFEEVYREESVDGITDVLSANFDTEIEKYIVCSRTQLCDVLSLFDDIYINVLKPVDYHSFDFNLELKKGKQVLSDDYIMKYLVISDDNTRSNIIVDVINSILVPEYTENSQKLFENFVNSCKTNISVIDYSENIDNLIIYSKAEEKFLPTVK